MCTLFEQLALLHEGVADTVGLAAELDGPSVIHDPVDHGGGHLVVAEHRPPPAELEVRSDRNGLPLVGVGEHLEEQPRPVRIEREEPQLVDHEQSGPPDERGPPVEPSVVANTPKPHHQRGGGEEARLEPPLAGQGAQRRGHMGAAEGPRP